MTALLVSAVVRDGRIAICDASYTSRVSSACKSWGDGQALTVRIEPEDDAIQHHQRKHYFGHVLGPVCDWTGYHKDELHEMTKAAFLTDDGRTSITQLSREEMRAFVERAEQFWRERFPEAFALL